MTTTCAVIGCNKPIPKGRAHNAKTCSKLHSDALRKQNSAEKQRRKRAKQKARRISMLKSLAKYSYLKANQTPVKIETSIPNTEAWLLAWPDNATPDMFSICSWRGTWFLHYNGETIRQRTRERWLRKGYVLPSVKIVKLED
jgi:hypothetical protein